MRANIVSGVNSKKILACAKKMINRKPIWRNPFGKGDSAKKIIQIIKNKK